MANTITDQTGGASISFTDFPEDVQLCILSFLNPSEIAHLPRLPNALSRFAGMTASCGSPCATGGGAPRPRSRNGATARSPIDYSTRSPIARDVACDVARDGATVRSPEMLLVL
jgi:hypothetical protein